jgi:hypothetical protein
MNLKKKYKIMIAIMLGLIAVIFAANLIISHLISKKVADLLNNQKIENYHLSIDKTSFSLFDRSMVISQVHLSPVDSSMIKLKQNLLGKNTLQKISISQLELRGIQLFPLIFSKKVIIKHLMVEDPLYQKYSNGIKSSEKQKPISIDSIVIKGINGFELDEIKVKNLKLQVINITSDEITFENKPMSFEFSGFKLEKINDQVYQLKPVENLFEIKNIDVSFPDKQYAFSIEKLQLNFEDSLLNFINLSYKPLINKVKLANSYPFNTEVYDLNIKDMKIFHVDLHKLVKNKGIFIDSIQISQLSIDIYKDKRKPFDESKRPQLPHNLLKNMEMPLLIHKISFENSQMYYEERLENKDILLKVNMKELNALLTNVTSIKEYRDKPLNIDLHTKFMGKADLDINMNFPLKDDQKTFYFSGQLAASELKLYDSAIIPAVGLKILQGNLESLTFNASANDYNSTGTMIMKYSDLEAEVFKHKNMEKSGFLSWSVNTLVHKSNPGKNGTLREVPMNFDRVMYKGFGNLLWKTLQSGIVNTIAPFGKTKEKVEAKKIRQTKREKKRQEK